MFYLAPSFEADLSLLNRFSLTEAPNMLGDAGPFDADLSRWNVWRITRYIDDCLIMGFPLFIFLQSSKS